MDNKEMNTSYISYKQLGLLVLVFTLGLIAALLMQNTKMDAQTTFTTTELIGFVLSVILSGASIVLAVSAIALGKSSEQAVINRSDESIRMQNETFVKTIEALKRIESSTGVTEKRIEDIISGRVGDISNSIAELTSRNIKGHRLNKDEIEKEVRRSIMKEVKAKRSPEEEEERKKKILEKNKRYEDFHQLTLSSFSNREDTKSEKLGHGSTGGEGIDLFDGLFHIGDKKIGLSAFHESDSEDLSHLDTYITEVAKSLIGNVIQHAVLVFDCSPSKLESITEKVFKKMELFKDSPYSHISIVASESDGLEVALNELDISNK